MSIFEQERSVFYQEENNMVFEFLFERQSYFSVISDIAW